METLSDLHEHQAVIRLLQQQHLADTVDNLNWFGCCRPKSIMMSVEWRQEQRSIINGSKPSGIKIRAIACGWYLALIIYHNSILNNIFHYMT